MPTDDVRQAMEYFSVPEPMFSTTTRARFDEPDAPRVVGTSITTSFNSQQMHDVPSTGRSLRYRGYPRVIKVKIPNKRKWSPPPP